MNQEITQNIPNKFEGKALSALEDYTNPTAFPGQGSMWSPAGEEITNVNYLCTGSNVTSCKGEKEVGEIKA